MKERSLRPGHMISFEEARRPGRGLKINEVTLKVAMTVDPPIHGRYPNGVSTTAQKVTHELKKCGDTGVVITPSPGDQSLVDFPLETLPSVEFAGITVCSPTKQKLKHLIKEPFDGKPDVLHVAAPFSELGANALKLANKKGWSTVAIYQTDVPGYARDHYWGDWAYRTVKKRVKDLHNRAAMTLAPSSEAINQLDRYGVDMDRVKLWGRGVDTELYRPEIRHTEAVQQLRRRWSPDDKSILGYVGRLAPEKSLEDLANLNLSEVQLVLVGGGPSEQELRELYPEAIFAGRLDGESLAEAYAAFDIFIHTGRRETFGQTLQEAMTTGLPVIAPRLGGPIDIVSEGQTGELYDPDDFVDLQQHVDALVESESLRRSYGEAGRRFVEGKSWSALTAQLRDFYRQVQ